MSKNNKVKTFNINDELKKLEEYKKKQDFSSSLKSLSLIADYFKTNKKFTKAIDYYKEIIEISDEDNKFDNSEAFLSLGDSFFNIREYDSALEYYEISSELLKKSKKTDKYKESLVSLLKTYLRISDNSKVLDLSKEIEKIAKKDKDENLLQQVEGYKGIALNNMGEVQEAFNIYPMLMNYLKK
ncbi:MAG: hypothetical protein U0354_16420 [Candidatus Sericytochromatia bacterium]